MVKANIGNPRNAGRPAKYQDDELLRVIDEFMLRAYRGEVNASQVAKFARDHMGYKTIKYYHFTQREKAMKKINEISEFNSTERRNQSSTVTYFQNIEIDAFYNKYKNNEFKLKNALLQLQEKEKGIYNNLIKAQNENKNLHYELSDSLNQINDLQFNAKSLQKENCELKRLNKTLTKLISVQDQVEMCKYVLSKTYMDGDLGDQYILTLLKCGVIKDKDANEIKEAAMKGAEQQQLSPSNIVDLFKRTTTDETTINKDNVSMEGDEDGEVLMKNLNALLDE